jgi:hypothetical protein
MIKDFKDLTATELVEDITTWKENHFKLMGFSVDLMQKCEKAEECVKQLSEVTELLIKEQVRLHMENQRLLDELKSLKSNQG